MIGPLPFDALSTTDLYQILNVRAEVFVVEQDCPYQDLDGKDQASLHIWMNDDVGITAYARLLPPGLSYPEAGIGRVVTASRIRKTGLGKELMRHAIAACQMQWPDYDVVIMAQSYLLAFYQSFGFVEERAEFLEDGIPHRWMRLTRQS
ncbi:MAG TPA: GNAT family N-acetyltransferase [Cryomorphaceae bacterium]|nr:GNAT family N-acetyltransferase [Cryomorphaceae bacterium]